MEATSRRCIHDGDAIRFPIHCIHVALSSQESVCPSAETARLPHAKRMCYHHTVCRLQNGHTGNRTQGLPIASRMRCHFAMCPHTNKGTNLKSKCNTSTTKWTRWDSSPGPTSACETRPSALLQQIGVVDSLAEPSKAVAQGAIPKGRGLEPHSCHSSRRGTPRRRRLIRA